ncbi:UNVERIFIED_CONTAM: SAC3 family protein C [Sesamum calycinum]|uniref:SAC3 family protein C n=1 Tax=Sesamum calycinum TaxID=2727403 RepID=A0AAW2R6G5_9LAMI
MLSRRIVTGAIKTISTKDAQASDVRPVPVLEDTLNYLLNLLHSSDQSFAVVHDFIFDRTRSIRQDLSMQNAVSDQVIHMYERMVKFHIISHRHLYRSFGNPNIASVCHLNMEQLMKALTTLLNLYEANRASHSMCQNEAEFSSFFLLLHLGSDKQVEPLSLWFRSIPSPIMKSKEIYYRLGNYKRFISTTEEEASYLQYCIIEPYINEESDVESLCTDCALETSSDGTGKGLLPTKQSVITKSAGGLQKYYPLESQRIESSALFYVMLYCRNILVMHRATRALVAACIIVFLAPRKGGSLTANSFSYTKTDTLALMETSQALNE